MGNDHSFVKFAIADVKITTAALASPIGLPGKKTINGPAAKEVCQILFDQGGYPAEIVKARGLAQVSDTGVMETFADQAIAANLQMAAEILRTNLAP